MDFVLLYLRNNTFDHPYSLMLNNLAATLRLTQPDPQIYLLSDVDLAPIDGVKEIRRVKSNNPWHEKLRLLDYVGDLGKFYFMDLDQIVFGKLDDFEEDLVGDSFGVDCWTQFLDVRGALKEAYGLLNYVLLCTGFLGVTVNDRTRELFKLAERLWLERAVKLSFVWKADVSSEPYFCIALSQLLFKIHGKDYITFKQFGGIVYDWNRRGNVDPQTGRILDSVKVWHFQNWKRYAPKHIDKWLSEGKMPDRAWISVNYKELESAD